MADTDQEAKKMTSRKASTTEESTTSESILDNDVTMKDEGYSLNKGVKQRLPWPRISFSRGKSGGSGDDRTDLRIRRVGKLLNDDDDYTSAYPRNELSSFTYVRKEPPGHLPANDEMHFKVRELGLTT